MVVRWRPAAGSHRGRRMHGIVSEIRRLAGEGFPVRAERIEILDSPADFYERLLQSVASSRSRISLSSLYLGTGSLERSLAESLRKVISNHGDLSVNVVLDYHRGQRRDRQGECSMSVLSKLATCFPAQFKVHLFRVPQWRWIHDAVVRWPRWKELVGVQHAKLYVFDDTVIISGANLSNDYFVNRQDRYYVIRDAALADFSHDLVARFARWSHRLQHDGLSLSRPLEPPSTIDVQPDKRTSAKRDEGSMGPTDTFVFPTIQLDVAGVRLDHELLTQIVSGNLSPSDGMHHLTLASGYLNLTPDFQEMLANFPGTVSLVTASPMANGFYGAAGVSRFIPDAYAVVVNELLARMPPNKCEIFEYERTGWTYHQKGLWLHPSPTAPPALTVSKQNHSLRVTPHPALDVII
ncbi:unnamed protein product (mitochondrion) [Plasmodiophora brassicae]|uniref:CDP-diacylglycerol--glycerol-3-phosphate 3-phosphatidyltransferase n=1 Tax=Plasmodiophora brassicae TaxID=37360 RepID=A0A3P3YBZ0_PLABS|nr:unnamed protein product [Plasmodiophora brassicae]